MNPTPSHERICLLTGGGYPFRRDALSGWCRTLVEGLRRHRFELLTVTDRESPSAPAYPLPLNVGSARAVALSGSVKERRNRHAAATAEHAAGLLCRGLLGDHPQAGNHFSAGLREFAELAAAGPAALSAAPLADLLVDSWRAVRPAAGEPPLPKMSTRDARTAATLLRHALGALAVELPEADLVHCVGGTTPLLGALAGHWRTQIPMLLTEARAPVPRHKPTEERLSVSVRTVLRRFRSAVARTGYAEAGLIAPLSAYHHDWALRHGAHPDRLVRVPAGVDPAEYPGAAEPNGDPAVVWAGSGGPDSGLAPLLAAFEQVAAALPGTVLHLVGVTPVHEDHCAEQIERTGLGRAVRLHPLPADPRDRYTLGHVVAHVPGPADPPYRLIEAMMSGRAVVGVDVGPAGETLGDAGVLVQPDDPAELAIAVVNLLRTPARRRALGDAARRRALLHFTNDRVVRVYDALYSDLAAPEVPMTSFELSLAVPAPRTELPATMRWLSSPAPEKAELSAKKARPSVSRVVIPRLMVSRTSARALNDSDPLPAESEPHAVESELLPASFSPAGLSRDEEIDLGEAEQAKEPPKLDVHWPEGLLPPDAPRRRPASAKRPPVPDAPWLNLSLLKAGEATGDRGEKTGDSVLERLFREQA